MILNMQEKCKLCQFTAMVLKTKKKALKLIHSSKSRKKSVKELKELESKELVNLSRQCSYQRQTCCISCLTQKSFYFQMELKRLYEHLFLMKVTTILTTLRLRLQIS